MAFKKCAGMGAIGFDELFKKFDELGNISNTKDTREIIRKAAGRIKGDAQRRLNSQVVRRTGTRLNPEKAIVAKLFSKQKPHNPMAFVAWDYKVSQLGHIFERGTRKMAARPFFRPAIDNKKGEAAKVIERDLAKLIDKTARKK